MILAKKKKVEVIDEQIDESIDNNGTVEKKALTVEDVIGKKANKKEVITKDQVQAAEQTLKKYKDGKKNFDQRVIDNEEWWRLRHWELLNHEDKTVEPVSAWLFNSVMNKLADYSDNIPEPNIRAKMQDDVAEAQRLKNLLPMIYEANNYEKTYMDTSLSKIKNGTSITGIFWNQDKDFGLGDVDIQPIDVLSIYWEPGIKDIQKSRNIFTIELWDNDLLQKSYPNVEIQTGSQDSTLAKYIYEDSIDTSEKTAVVDWYYKKDGKLQYCKFCNGSVLVATENEPETYPNGLYDDGEYPFVVDTLFKQEGTIAGFGYLDVCKSPQEYIDKMDELILKNAQFVGIPRYFYKNGASINEDDFTDLKKALIPCGSNLGQDDLRPVDARPIPNTVYEARDSKINELKQTSGNSDVSTGTASSGVTAASAISQLIETGSKGSRLTIKSTYNAFKEITYKVIERIRQFYDLPRYVRIIGDDGMESFETYDNSRLIEQIVESPLAGQPSHRLPMFDIEVSAQKASPYNKMAQNELALEFYQRGFFAPNNADATLTCLQMMDFDHKQDVVAMIKKNGTLLDMVQQLQMENQKLKVMCDLYVPGSNLTGDIQPPVTGQQTAGVGSGETDLEMALGDTTNSITEGDGTNSQAQKARQQVADSTEV